MTSASNIRCKCQVMINDQSKEAESCIIFQLRERKAIDRFCIEYDYRRIDLLQKCFCLYLKKDLAQIQVQAISSFSESFVITYNADDLLKFADFIPFQPEYGRISTQNFYWKKEKASIQNIPKEESFDSVIINEMYAKQDDAFRRFDKLEPKQRSICKLFSFESFQTGQRKFCVLDRRSFHESYFYELDSSSTSNSSTSAHKHVYEIIRESFPCRLYFDLEYSKIANPSIDGDELTQRFIGIVFWKLYDWFQLSLDWNDVIVLDSTTESKFSKHVIIHMKRSRKIVSSHTDTPSTSESIKTMEYLLPNNIVVQDLLRSIINDITEEVVEEASIESPLSNKSSISTSHSNHEINRSISIIKNGKTPNLENKSTERQPKPEFKDFWLRTEENQLQFFVDLGVYSRNRAFRLFDSSKYGKQQAFRLIAADKRRYSFQYSQVTDYIQMKIELLDASYIIPFDILLPESVIPVALEQKDRNSLDFMPHIRNEGYYGFEVFLPYFNYHKYRIISFPTDSHQYFDSTVNPLLSYQRLYSNSSSASAASVHSFRCSSWKNQALLKSKYPREGSPFPLLDQYLIRTIAQEGGIQGILQEWMIFLKANGDFPIYKIRYQVGRNRFCANICRPHKSNGIYYEVNLMTREFVQMCWDPDCRGFQSPVVILPDLILPNPSEIETTIKTFTEERSE